MAVKKTGVLKPMAPTKRAGAPAYTKQGICVGQTAVFAKGILDKYTKILNYQFDQSALVFLEQTAGGETERQPLAQVISMTCRLLSYLVRNMTQVNLFSNTDVFLGRQLTAQMEQNLFMLQESSPKAYRELEGIYQQYRKVSQNPQVQASGSPGEKAGEIRRIQHRLQKQIEELEAAQKQIFSMAVSAGEAGGSDRAVTKNPYRMPFSLTHSFFANLNRCIEGNRFQNYRRRWQLENERQMRQYELKCHMQHFLKEQDLFKQEEQLAGMIRQYGKESLRQYLQEADAQVFEHVLPVLSVLTGRDATYTAGQSNTVLQNLPGTGQRLRQADRDHVQTAGQPQEDPESRLLAEYRQAEAGISLILANSDEITKNVLLEKTGEYRELFYRYIRSEDLARQPDGSSGENPEIFSDAEIAVLLNLNDSGREQPDKIQTGEIKTGGIRAGEIQTEGILTEKIPAEREILERKLNLLAFREISERFLQEESTFLQKEVLEQILRRLEHVSLSASGNGEPGGSFVPASGNGGPGGGSVSVSGNGGPGEASVPASGNGGPGGAFVLVSGNQERDQTVWQDRKDGFMEHPDIAAGTEGKERQTDDAAADIQRVFEQGSLAQRKLYYLSMVRAVDEMLIEEQEKAEGQPADIRQLVQWKKQLQEADAKADSAAGDWRFLLTKAAGQKLLHLVTRSPGPEQARFSQRVWQTVMNFYLKAAGRQDALSGRATGASSGSETGALQGSETGALQGGVPDALPGGVPDVLPGGVPDALPGSETGSLPGGVPDALSDRASGALSDTVPGAMSDTVFRMEWGGVFDQEEWEQLQDLAQAELSERKLKMRSRALQEWQSLFRKEELDALAKGRLLQKDPGREPGAQKHPYERNLKEQNLSGMMETAGLLERRLLHLSMQQAVNELLAEQDRNDESGHTALVRLKHELEEKDGTDGGLPKMMSRMTVPVQNKIEESMQDIITQFFRQQNWEMHSETMQMPPSVQKNLAEGVENAMTLFHRQSGMLWEGQANPETIKMHSQLMKEWAGFFQQEELKVLAEGGLIQKDQKDSGAGQHLQGHRFLEQMEAAGLLERKLLYLSAVHVTDGLLRQSSGNDREAYRQLDRLKKELQRPEDDWKAGMQSWDFLLDSDWNGRMTHLIQQMPESVQKDLTEGTENVMTLFRQAAKAGQSKTGQLHIQPGQSKTGQQYHAVAPEDLRHHIGLEPEQQVNGSAVPKDLQRHIRIQEPETEQQYNEMAQEAVRQHIFAPRQEAVLQHISVPQPEAVPLHSDIPAADRWQQNQERLEILLQDMDAPRQEGTGIRSFSLIQGTDAAARSQRADYGHYRKILQENRNAVLEDPDMGLKIRSPQKFMQPPEPGEPGPQPASQNGRMTERAPFSSQAAADRQNREPVLTVSARPELTAEQVYALPQGQHRQSGEQAGREEGQKLQQLEGELLDYKNELRIRSDQLEQMEKKIISQGKEIQVIQQSQHTVSKKVKSAMERRQALNQIKNELQMERMRTGRT